MKMHTPIPSHRSTLQKSVTSFYRLTVLRGGRSVEDATEVGEGVVERAQDGPEDRAGGSSGRDRSSLVM
jgi:hypothetical protein